MTLNVWQGRLERVLLKYLETLDIDFACMQEAVDYEGSTAGLATPYRKIGKTLRLEEQYFSRLTHTTFGDKDMYFGNAIYGNIPFEKMDTVFTRGAYKENFNFDADDHNIRAFQHVELTCEGKRLHLINHHGHHINEHKRGDDETLRQATQIADYAKQLDGAVIVCGDFNLAPDSASIQVLDGVLNNLSVSNSLKTTRSDLTYKNEVCDYIFVNDSVRVNEFFMEETIISDHNALFLDFDLK